VPDIRLANALLEGTPFVAADRAEESDERGGVLALTHAVVIQVADILRAVKQGLSDDKLDHRDRARIKAEAAEAENLLASLRVLLDADPIN
jgi:hypothetical protein